MLARERDYFGNFDPFGDFDLISSGETKPQFWKQQSAVGTAFLAKPRFHVSATAGCC